MRSIWILTLAIMIATTACASSDLPAATFTPVPTVTPTPTYPVATEEQVEDALNAMMAAWGRCWDEGGGNVQAANALVNDAMEEALSIQGNDGESQMTAKSRGATVSVYEEATSQLRAKCPETIQE